MIKETIIMKRNGGRKVQNWKYKNFVDGGEKKRYEKFMKWAFSSVKNENSAS